MSDKKITQQDIDDWFYNGSYPTREPTYHPTRRDFFAAAVINGLCAVSDKINLNKGDVTYIVDNLIKELDEKEEK